MDADDEQLKLRKVALREVAQPRFAADVALQPQQRAHPRLPFGGAQLGDILFQLFSLQPAKDVRKAMLGAADLGKPQLLRTAEVFQKSILPVRIDRMRMVICGKFHSSLFCRKMAVGTLRDAADLLAQQNARSSEHFFFHKADEAGDVLRRAALVQDKIRMNVGDDGAAAAHPL